MTGAKFEFIAELSASKSVMAKQWSPGELHLTLVVKQPGEPHRPEIPWDFNASGQWKPRPESLKKKPKETDGEFGTRNQQRAEEQKRWDTAHEKWKAAMVVYEQEKLLIAKRTMDYATMVGISSILGAKPLQVTIQPVQSGMFDNFGLSLIGPGSLEPDDDEGDIALDVTPSEDDPPCPDCGHPLATSHDDDEELGGCSVIIDGADELCACERRPTAVAA